MKAMKENYEASYTAMNLEDMQVKREKTIPKSK